MKAIIMAGGEGSRLRPLTCDRPKPMVPVANRPMMEHIVELLKKYGFREIGVTLQYMPDAIRAHFGSGVDYGVNLRYFVEEVPLGTAGSVKNASSFLDQTFLVISGDALTDLDLSSAVEFHKKKGSIATLVLTRVECPLEYGVVITDKDGRIVRFLEKPGWGEVFSDTVNTGIYVLEPEVLEHFEHGQMFDFSKDLFPLLLKKGYPVFGVILDGYWCDVGNISQYIQAHHDVLSGQVKINVEGEEIAPGVRVGLGVEISPSAVIEGPVLLGDGTLVGDGARIGPYTVIGKNCIVQKNASLKKSVLWDNVYVGVGAGSRGAVLGSRVQVQAGAAVYEGAVVGSDSVIRERGTVKPNVKLWPHKVVESGATVCDSLVWGTRAPKRVFGLDGITGLANIEITPELGSRIAATFASVLGTGARVGMSHDGQPPSRMILDAVSSGLQSAGAEVYSFGSCITPAHRFAVKNFGCSGGVHVKVPAHRDELLTITLTDKDGANISRGMERKVENLLAREDFRRSEVSFLKAVKFMPGVQEAYLGNILSRLNREAVQKKRPKIILACNLNTLGRFIEPLGGELNLAVESVDFRNWRERQAVMEQVKDRVVREGALLGALMDSNAEYLILIDGRGNRIADDMLTAVIALIILKSNGGPVVVPVTAPRAIEALAEKYRGSVVRTKTGIQDFLEQLIKVDGVDGNEKRIPQFLMYFDALFALLKIVEFTAVNDVTLEQLVDEIPTFFLTRREVAVPWEAKGMVIRRLIEENPAEELELMDGVKVFYPDGWALVLPDPEEPVCRVYSEGVSMEIAESLTDLYVDKISQFIKTG